MDNQTSLSAAGLAPYSQTLELAARFGSDPEPHVVSSAVVLLKDLGSGYLVDPGLLPNYRRFILATFQARARGLGWNPKPGESENEQLIRPDLLTLVSASGGDLELAREARELAGKWLAGERSLSANLLPAVLTTDAYYGDQFTVGQFLKAFKASHDVQERRYIIEGMRAFRDPAAIQAGLEAFLSGEVPPDEGFRLLFTGRYTKESRMPNFEFFKLHFNGLRSKIPIGTQSYLPYIGFEFCDAQSKTELKDFFEPHVDELPGARRSLAQVLETIDQCIAMKEIQEPAVTAFLQTKLQPRKRGTRHSARVTALPTYCVCVLRLIESLPRSRFGVSLLLSSQA